jgi:hypothetical protein
LASIDGLNAERCERAFFRQTFAQDLLIATGSLACRGYFNTASLLDGTKCFTDSFTEKRTNLKELQIAMFVGISPTQSFPKSCAVPNRFCSEPEELESHFDRQGPIQSKPLNAIL